MGRQFKNAAGCNQSAHTGQRTIHHNDLWSKFLGQPNCFSSVACFTGHINIGCVLEQAPESTPYQAVVVYK